MEEEKKVLTPEGNEPEVQETSQTPNELEGKLHEEPPKAQEPDYKEKFSQSSREAQLLAEQNKALQETIKNLTETKNPTDDELRQSYPGWDDLSAAEQTFMREQLSLKKENAATKGILLGFLEEQKWKDDLAGALVKYPELSGKDTEFKNFCYKPSHKNIPIDVLAKSFLYDSKPEPAREPAPPGAALEPGSGGPKEAPKGELSLDDIEIIRTKDPKRYRQLLREGKI